MDAVDRFQDTSALSVEINQLRLDNPIDALMRRNGVPRGVAESMFERNMDFANQTEAGLLPAADAVAGEGVPRPVSVDRGE